MCLASALFNNVIRQHSKTERNRNTSFQRRSSCSFCGAVYQKAAAKFCAKCGARRPADAVPAAPTSVAAPVQVKRPVSPVTSKRPTSPSASSRSGNAPTSLASTAKVVSTSALGAKPSTSAAAVAAQQQPPPQPRPATANSPQRPPSSLGGTLPASPAADTIGPSGSSALSRTADPATIKALVSSTGSADAASAASMLRPSSSNGGSSNSNGNSNGSGGDFVQVTKHLAACGLTHLLDKFRDQNINDAALPFVEEEDLAGLGIGVGAVRRKLLALFIPCNSPQQAAASSGAASSSGGGSGTYAQPGTTTAAGFASGAAPIHTVQVPDGAQALSPEVLETANAGVLRAWRRGDLLGRGANGSVWLGLVPETNQFLAVKTMALNLADPNNVAAGLRARDIIKISREIAMMRRVDHPNCCGFVGCCYNAQEREIHLFMELVTGGSLGAVAARFRPLPHPVILNWTRQLFQGIAYLHSLQLCHRDIKCANILVAYDKSGARLVLCDFGAAKRLSSAGAQAMTVVGSPYWLAPEILMQTDGYDAFKSDIWSAACTVCEMLTGHPPWPEVSNAPQAILMIAGNEGALPSRMPPVGQDGMTPALYAFLARCLNKDPTKRPSAAEALNDPFFVE